MKEHEGKVKIEELNSPVCTEPEIAQKSEDEFFSDNLRKIVKIEIGADDENKKSIEIDLQVNEEELNKLPSMYLEMLQNINLMKEMQSIALITGTCGNNPVESFERIRQGLSQFFPIKSEVPQDSFGLLMVAPEEHVDESAYANGNFLMEEEYDGFYPKELSKEFHSNEIRNYLEDIDSSDAFFRLERGL